MTEVWTLYFVDAYTVENSNDFSLNRNFDSFEDAMEYILEVSQPGDFISVGVIR